MSGTALTYITQAFSNLNVLQPGVTMPPALAADAFLRINLLMSTWAQQLTPATIGATGVPLLAGKRNYTWGPGGDITTPKPAKQTGLVHATLLLNTSNPPVEVPLAILTDDMVNAIEVKTLQSGQPTAVYYAPTTPLGTVVLWPVPNTAVNSLVLYAEQTFGPFADLSTTVYTFPDGYDEAIVYNLERRLAGPYGREMPAEDAILARETFANIMRSNQRLSDLPNDFAGVFGGGSSYDIERGE
jgi:hypothetical protein